MSAEGFQNYYKDLSLRMKNRELDLVIVVNMFLTGFDAPTLNTLFVDKNLRAHGLIQAYSRTNRILNSVKTYGNIVTFRDLEAATDAALELFGNRDASGVVLLRPYEEYFTEYRSKVDELRSAFPLGQPIMGEAAQRDFITLFGALLRLDNILTSFDQFSDAPRLSERESQDYRSLYLDLHAEYRGRQEAEREAINDDVVFEIELVKQVEINVDYILMLVDRYRKEKGNGEDREIRAEISRAVDASPTLRSKKDLIEKFVDSVSPSGQVDSQWLVFIRAQRAAELQSIIEDEDLRPAETEEFVRESFKEGQVRSSGMAITRVLPPVSRFSADGSHGEKKQRVVQKLGAFFERFFGLSSGDEE